MKVLSAVQPPMMDSSPRMQHALSTAAAQTSPAHSPKAVQEEGPVERAAANGPAANGPAAEEHKEEQREEGVPEQAEEQQEEQQEGGQEAEGELEAGLTEIECICPTPSITELDSSSALLEWGDPVYAPDVSELEDEPPPLQIHRFEVDWTQVTDPGDPIKEEDWRPLPSGDVDTQDVKVAGLRPGHTYAVRVRPVLDWEDVDQDNWDVHTLPSKPAIFTTLPSVPSQARPPALVSRERKALKVKWAFPDEPGGPDMQISYSLFVSPPPTDHGGMADPEGFVQVYSGVEPSFKLQRLLPGQRYTFWVLAWNQVGCSKRGLPATFTTQATVPSQPSPPVAVKSNETSISLIWKAPPNNGSDITSYTLERDEGCAVGQQPQTSGSGSSFCLAYAGPLLCAQVKGLHSGFRYRFRLRAHNSEGSSYWSECLVAATAATLPSCPMMPTVINTTRTSATVSWALPQNDGGARIVYHQVELQALSRPAVDLMGPDWMQTFEGTTMGCTFMNLRPGCSYRARMRSANSSGWGAFCFPVELATAADVPDAPGPPAIQEGGTNSLVVQWHPPLHNGGARITRYHLELTPLPGSTFSPSPMVLHLSQQHQHQQLAAAVPTPLPSPLPQSPIPPPSPLPSSPIPPMPSTHPLAQRMTAQQAQHALRVTPPLPPPPPPPPPRRTSPTPPLYPPDPLHLPMQQHPFHQPALLQQQQQALMVANSPSPEALIPLEPSPFLVYSGEEPVAQVTGLQPGGAYQFRVLAINSQGPGPWSDWGVLGTAAGVPPPPSPPVAASRPSSTAIAIKWQPPLSSSGAPVTSYVVQLLVVGFVPSEGGEPRLVVRKPAAALAQDLRLSQGMNGGGHRSRAGSGSHPLSGSTDMGSQGVASHGGASSASVSASTHSDEVLGENGLYQDLTGVAQAGGAEDLAPFAPQWMPVCKCNTTSTELRGLEPSTRYAIRVAAINRVGQGSWSADGLLQTAPAPPTPPFSVQVEAVGPKEIGVRWLPCALDNGAPLLAYAVDLLRLGAAGSSTFARLAQAAGSTGPWEHVLNTSPSESNALISGLHPGRSYRVRVRALNACGPSVPCNAPTLVTAHAAPPGPPGKVVVMQRGATHARFKWEPCTEENGAAVNQYWLEINGPVADDFSPSGDVAKPGGLNRRTSQADSADGSVDDLASAAVQSSGEGASAWRVAYVGASTQARVNGLLPATHYWCRVIGLNRMGPGACSQPEAFTSALLPPGPPQDPEVCVENAADVLDGSWAGPGAHAPTAANLRQANSEVVVVRWEPPASNPLEAVPVGYEVQATPCGTHGGALPGQQGSGEVRCSAPKNTLECVIERGLLPGVSYLVRVRTIGAGGSGHGAWSPAVEVVAPGKLGANSESAASVSDLNDGASSASYQPSMDIPTSRSGTANKRNKGKGQTANATGHTQQQPQHQRSAASGGKMGGMAHKVVAQASATALSKPAPPTMTIRGMKYQAGRLWRKTKAHKLQILVFLMVAAAGFVAQKNLSVEMLRQYRDQILLTLMVLVACALVWLIAMWIAWRSPPPKPSSKSKKKERAKAQGYSHAG